MTQTDQTVEHRRTWTADPDSVRVEDAGDGLFSIRMPLASTAEARDGRALERDVVDGWRQQIEAEPLPLFLDHGKDGLSRGRYGALSKVGYWTDPELVETEDGADLEAAAVVADPSELDEDVGGIREALAWLRTQAELGIPIASSAGWSEDTGDRDVPGGYDLMEGSIVGIPSDERTTTANADPVAVARAVEAASEEFDAETFLRELNSDTRDESMTDDDTPADDAGDEPDEQHEESAEEWRMTEDKYDRLMSRMDDLEAANDEELEILREMHEADYSDDGDDEDGDGDGGEEDDGGENAADTDTEERTVTIDGEEVDADEALDRLRDVAADDPDPDDPGTRDVGDDPDVEGEEADEQRDDEPDTNDDETPSFSFS